jgi:hypothetical protein
MDDRTPEQVARKVVHDVRDHGLFNVVNDETWVRYIAGAVRHAREASTECCRGLAPEWECRCLVERRSS